MSNICGRFDDSLMNALAQGSGHTHSHPHEGMAAMLNPLRKKLRGDNKLTRLANSSSKLALKYQTKYITNCKEVTEMGAL